MVADALVLLDLYITSFGCPHEVGCGSSHDFRMTHAEALIPLTNRSRKIANATSDHDRTVSLMFALDSN